MKRTKTLDQMLASIRAGIYAHQQRAHAEARREPPVPFITISRQAGAGGRTLAYALADHLSANDPAGRPWTVWDRELVEKVADEQHIPTSLVESLETGTTHRSAFEDFLASLSARNDSAGLDEFQVYRRVAATVRVLAHAGRAVIVGRGSVYATSDLPGGVHLRLVAPLQERIARTARQRNTSEQEAAKEVARIDRHRDAFHRRYWPNKALLPEIFTLTLNTGLVTEQQMVKCVLPLVGEAAAGSARSSAVTELAGVSPCCAAHAAAPANAAR